MWKNSRDRKWRFKGCPSDFFEKQKKITTVEKMTLKKGHCAVFITIDGKDYLLGQVLVLVTVDGKINNYISEWRGMKKLKFVLYVSGMTLRGKTESLRVNLKKRLCSVMVIIHANTTSVLVSSLK